jgi:hypothetical protein
MAKSKIPDDIKEAALAIIEKYNKKKFRDNPDVSYYAKFRGEFLYLNRKEYGNDSPIARLGFNGSMKDWSFSAFLYSCESYSDDLFMMPGIGFLDGTIEGALKAGDKVYPV